MENLPAEIISFIFDHLDLESRIHLGLSSRVFLEEAKRKTQYVKTVLINQATTITKTWFTVDGKKERETEYYKRENRILYSVIWYRYIDGWYYKYKENRPAIVRYLNGRKLVEQWFQIDLHRRDGPAETVWYRNGIKESEIWYVRGKKHREQTGVNLGPAEVKWYDNGNKWYETWQLNDTLHRNMLGDNAGPAKTVWEYDGKKEYELWYLYGRRKREKQYKERI